MMPTHPSRREPHAASELSAEPWSPRALRSGTGRLLGGPVSHWSRRDGNDQSNWVGGPVTAPEIRFGRDATPSPSHQSRAPAAHMRMRTSTLHGKILALLREYRFGEVPDGFVRRFFTRSRTPLLRGMGLEWWLTRPGLHVRNDLARMIVDALPQLPLRVNFVAETIEKVLQDHADDGALFQQFAYHRADALLDISAVPAPDLAEAIWSLIKNMLERAVTEWLVVVPFHRIRGSSRDLGFDGLYLLEANDIDAWRKVAAEFANAEQWDPRTGVRDAAEPKVFGERPPRFWGLCRALGTREGAIAVARDRFRTFIALLFSLEHSNHPELLLKTPVDPPTFSVQFAAKHARLEWPQRYSHIGALMPQSPGEITLADDLLERVRKWYSFRNAAEPEKRQRAVVASQFVQFGLVAEDLERFIHFFVSLDALFGTRGKVEATVGAGIARALGASEWADRAAKLFDLRNEVLHGGSSAIDEWPWYEEYRRHFRSEPLSDVAIAALSSLREFFG